MTVPEQSRRRYAAGRRIRVPKKVVSVRDMMRRHLYEERRDQGSLAKAWNVKPATVKSIFMHGRPISPQYIDAFVEDLGLDEFDAQQLRWHGAIEAGWQLDRNLLDVALYMRGSKDES